MLRVEFLGSVPDCAYEPADHMSNAHPDRLDHPPNADEHLGNGTVLGLAAARTLRRTLGRRPTVRPTRCFRGGTRGSLRRAALSARRTRGGRSGRHGDHRTAITGASSVTPVPAFRPGSPTIR